MSEDVEPRPDLEAVEKRLTELEGHVGMLAVASEEFSERFDMVEGLIAENAQAIAAERFIREAFAPDFELRPDPSEGMTSAVCRGCGAVSFVPMPGDLRSFVEIHREAHR